MTTYTGKELDEIISRRSKLQHAAMLFAICISAASGFVSACLIMAIVYFWRML